MQILGRPIIPVLLVASAWLGGIICLLYTFGLVNGALISRTPGFSIQGAEWMRFSDRDFVLVGLRCALQLAALFLLHQVDAAWLRAPGLHAGLAKAVRRLAHALVLIGILGVAVPIPDFTRWATGAALSAQRLGFQPLYMLAVGCLCLYAMAWFIDQGLALKAENEGFV